jgi:hypothetical protein
MVPSKVRDLPSLSRNADYPARVGVKRHRLRMCGPPQVAQRTKRRRNEGGIGDNWRYVCRPGGPIGPIDRSLKLADLVVEIRSRWQGPIYHYRDPVVGIFT